MENVQILWDFMHMGQLLEKADVIVGFGCYDEDIPRRCAELWHQGFAPFVCFSGGLGRNTSGIWSKSEAERFAAIAMAAKRSASLLLQSLSVFRPRPPEKHT